MAQHRHETETSTETHREILNDPFGVLPDIIWQDDAPILTEREARRYPCENSFSPRK